MPLRVVPRRDRKLNREVKSATLVPLKRGAVVYDRGDPADGLVLVREGHLRLMDHGRGRRARTIHVVGPWEMTGEEALISSPARRHRAVAGEASAIQWLDARKVLSVLTTSRVTREAFMTAWIEERAILGHLVAGSGAPDAGGRLASVLLDLGRRLGTGDTPTIPIQLTHQTLADLAGIHRSTATTLLNDWLYRDWIAEAPTGISLKATGRLLKCSGLRELG